MTHQFKEHIGSDFHEIHQESSGMTVYINSSTLTGYFTDGDEEGITGGLWFDDAKSLSDYDGVPELPALIVQMIEKVGYAVPESFL